MPDEMRLRRTLAHIQNNRRLWNQNTWVGKTECGTTYCFAGWAVVLEGIPVSVTEGGMAFIRQEDVPELWMAKIRERRFDYLADNYNRVAISDMAAVILDLSGEGRDPNEHWALFGACLSLPAMRETVDRLCAGKEPIRGGVYGSVREGSEDTEEAEGPGIDGTGTVPDAG